MNFVKIIFLFSIARTCLAQGDAGWADEYFPRNQRITEVYSTSFVFAWDKPENTTLQIDKYRILVLACDNSSCATPDPQNCGGPSASTKDLSYTVKTSPDGPIKSRTWYKVGVCAKYNSGTTYPPRIKNLQTGPAPSTNITSNSSAPGELLIEWQDDDNVTNSEESDGSECNEAVNGYQVNLTLSGDGMPATEETSEKHLSISGLNSNAQYTITVVSTTCNNITFSDESEPGTGITLPEKVSTPTVSSITTSSMRVAWVKNSEGSVNKTYTVKLTPSDGKEVSEQEIQNSSKTISNLTSNTDYSVTVEVVNAAGSSPSDVVKYPTIPEKVTGLRNNSAATTSSIFLEWDNVSGNSTSLNYSVLWKPEPNNGKEKNETTSVNFLEVSNLTSNTNYKLNVLAFNDGGDGSTSMNSVFTTLPQKLSPPIAESITNSSISLTWNENKEGSVSKSYTVTWESNGKVQSDNGIETLSKVITGLESNTKYTVNVEAINKAGSSGKSSNNFFTTIFNSPTSIKTKQDNSALSVNLTWTAPDMGGNATNITKYEVNCIPSNCICNVQENSAYVYNLSSNEDYVITVNTLSSANVMGTASEPISVTTIPGVPQFNSNQPETNTTAITVVWNKPIGGNAISMYSVQHNATETTTGESNYSTDASIPHDVDIDTYSHTIHELEPGQRYEVRVAANNSEGWGEPSYDTRRTVPAPVNDPKATKNSADASYKIDLTWNPPAGVGDDIEISYVGFQTQTSNSNITDFYKTNYTVDVLPGDNYTFTFITRSGNLTSQEIIRQSTSTPSVPRLVKTSSNASAITVTWSPPEGYAEYVVLRIGSGTEIKSPPDAGCFVFSSLSPKTSYPIEIYATVTNIDGDTEESRRIITVVTTDSNSTTDIGLIVGLVVAAVAVVAIILGGLYYYRKKSAGKGKNTSLGGYLNPIGPTTLPTPETLASSNVVKLSDFDQHMEAMRADYSTKFGEEFDALAHIGRNQSHQVALLPANHRKNRYKNILPYDNNTASLKKKVGESNLEYINASYISTRKLGGLHDYIATQGPLPSTTHDFWRLVWERNSRSIVMVTQVLESGKVKCECYWPPKGESIPSGEMTIKTISESASSDWTFRKFKVVKNNESRIISHFHYTAWPDHGVPETTESLVKFVNFVRTSVDREEERGGPSVVHCSAGVGRTGTFIAMDHLMQRMKTHSSVDIFGLVYQLRMQRMFMVQTEKQYILLHKMVQDINNHVYDVFEDPVYENAAEYENMTKIDPIYENTQLNGN